MEEQVKLYYENMHKPWVKLFYNVIEMQLSDIMDLKVLDFGSGFGILSNSLAKNNEVIAIEPNVEMVKNRLQDNKYVQIIGGLDQLRKIESNSFDVIICHNVLEYVSERIEVVNEFYRILRDDGFLSIVKHNRNGRIMQKIVFENNIDEALSILNGGYSLARYFGKINYYDNLDILKWQVGFTINKIYGVRTFWALQQNNDIKYDSYWQNKMLQADLAVSEIDDFIKISFYNHLIIKKI